jgi:hypothetical protein
MKREQRKEKVRRQRKEKILELMGLGCHQALVSRIMNLSKPTIKQLQREMGLPPRLPISRSKQPYGQNKAAAELVDAALQTFWGGQLPADTDALVKVMTALPQALPDALKTKMNEEQWQAYRSHATRGIVAAIRARQNRQYMN